MCLSAREFADTVACLFVLSVLSKCQLLKYWVLVLFCSANKVCELNLLLITELNNLNFFSPRLKSSCQLNSGFNG